MDVDDYKSAQRVVALAAKGGTSLVTALRTFRNMSDLELAAKTGMPVERFRAEADQRLSFADNELDRIATALGVEVDIVDRLKDAPSSVAGHSLGQAAAH